MARLILTAVTIFLLACAAVAGIDGGWTGERDEHGRLQLMISRAPGSQIGLSFRFDELTGLTAEQMSSTVQTAVSFQYRTDAGTLAFEGVLRNGRGGGQMTFTGNPEYAQQVRALGFQLDRGDDAELFRLAAIGVSVAYIREMKAIYPEADLREISKLRAVGVTPAWLREMRAAGVEIGNAHEARKLAAIGVTSAFIRQLADAGYRNLSVRDLTRLAAAGVDGRFIRDMQKYKQ